MATGRRDAARRAEGKGPGTSRAALLSDLLDTTAHLAPSDVLDGVARTIVSHLPVERAALWTLDPSTGALAVAASAGRPLDDALESVPVGTSLIGRVAERRAPLRESAREAGAEAGILLTGHPLMVRGRVVGVLGVWHAAGFGPDESALLARTAEAAATAAERHNTELRTRSVLATLNEIGRTLVAELDLDRLLQLVTDAGTTLTEAASGAFLHRTADERGGSTLRSTVSGPDPAAFEGLAARRATPILEPTLSGRRTVRYHDVTAEPTDDPLLPHPGGPDGHRPVRSYLAVPVVSRTGEVIGALVLGHPEPGRFSETDELLVQGIAGYAAVAIENARQFQEEQQIALTLQRALLPVIDPRSHAIDVAVRYLPAVEHAEVGGDWYDVASLPDGSLAVTVGDVEGHSIQAAARMGTVRTALSVFARSQPDPARALADLDAYLTGIGLRALVTAVLAVYEPGTGLLHFARAGHPPPLMLHADGRAELLDRALGPAVGLGIFGTGPEVAECKLTPGNSIVFYTDGLVERPGVSLDDSFEELRAAAAGRAFASGEEVCDHLVASLVGGGGTDDDVALLVLRAAPDQPPSP